MRVVLLEPYGYCVGVERAIEIALKTRSDNPNKRVIILGMLIHNEDALKELEAKGIETLYHKDKSLLDLVDELPKDALVILTAHGHSDELERKLNERRIEFIDATCPFVKATFKRILEASIANHNTLYIGKKNHPESNAALSISDKVKLVDIDNPSFDVKDASPLVISQTTFSHREISEVVDNILKKYPNATVFPSVCQASTDRQNAILSLDKNIELIYVVGGVNSNNTKTLAKLAKEHCPKAKVILIQNKDDINKKDLIGLSYIAIASGASTPKHISEEVKASIENLLN